MKTNTDLEREWILKAISKTSREVHLLADLQKLQTLYSKYHSRDTVIEDWEWNEDLKWINSFYD